MNDPTLPSSSTLPHSPAAERNKAAILEKLKQILSGTETVLEIGCGTAQHAIHFAREFPKIVWLPTDLPERLSVANAILATADLNNIKTSVALDMSTSLTHDDWPDYEIDVVYTANTVHIMPWSVVQNMIVAVAEHLDREGIFIVYGPFKYGGDFTTESNRMFNESLKRRNSVQGIRDYEAIERLAREQGLHLVHDFSMPANNQLLVFEKK